MRTEYILSNDVIDSDIVRESISTCQQIKMILKADSYKKYFSAVSKYSNVKTL